MFKNFKVEIKKYSNTFCRYICIHDFCRLFPVPEWSSEECVNSGNIDVKPDNGYLSFRVGHSVPAGTASCPWKVTGFLLQ